mgnify:CR=1 FL=1|jgi:hypothetical protein
MTDTAHMPVAASAQIPSTRQRAFNRYSTAFLIYLVVLNLFAEFWDRLFIQSFSYSLLASLILVVMLKATLVFEKRVARFFNSRQGTMAKVMRYITEVQDYESWNRDSNAIDSMLGVIGEQRVRGR